MSHCNQTGAASSAAPPDHRSIFSLDIGLFESFVAEYEREITIGSEVAEIWRLAGCKENAYERSRKEEICAHFVKRCNGGAWLLRDLRGYLFHLVVCPRTASI